MAKQKKQRADKYDEKLAIDDTFENLISLKRRND